MTGNVRVLTGVYAVKIAVIIAIMSIAVIGFAQCASTYGLMWTP